MISWLNNLVNKIVPRYKNYEAALQAIRKGDKVTLELLLQQNPPLIRISYCTSGSLLHNAAMFGQVEITKMLIARGADVNDASTRDSEAPIHFAAEAGKLETIKILIEHGAKIDLLCYKSTQSPLDRAVWSQSGAHKDIIRYLVENGAKHSSIHVASVLGDIERAKDALKSGNDVNSPDRSGRTPLHWAIQGGDTAKIMIDFLIDRGADVEGTALKGSATPLYLAASTGNRTAVDALTAHGANVNAEAAFGGRPFTVAQSQGHREIARLLLESGADACTANAFGETALHDAAAENDVDMLRTLLDRGCDPNTMSRVVPIRLPGGQRAWNMTPRNALTPLHIAANCGHILAAELLIQHGADINKQDHQGHTPLHSAVVEGQTEIVSLLLSRGADSAIRNKKGKTPLELAIEAGKEGLVSTIQAWERGRQDNQEDED